ncbi:saccharopine dehydrogenase family protein [Luteipulveratus flavus]|uniref:Saccharopine dehydrogenase NADP-binding domain-containing protein n=1 Tax=Luteipulveratus flavus TaxID=3031728 RepID=A0ABT6C2G4_9MICO|nr:saccharopine dehydrogenase NADP-binding domain-containing protein [Luteipulveratus sp. YIM 133296]MDF8262870.1 saccharopine dehydrogenase NADP-binding domain-containing protein [Luteipulveratus sp. YIM 133296]
MSTERVMVYGAAGHTGRFVIDELLSRGLTPVLAGRNEERLSALASRYDGLERRVVGVEDADRLREALAGITVVVNVAGPFLDTALPLARAAVEAGAHYLDVTAEQPAVQQLYDELDAPARSAGVSVVPAMAFYGGLADLLTTAALDGEPGADEVKVAIGLDRWWPTEGTRVTGDRNTAVRQVIRGGVLAPLESPAPTGTWSFPGPLGVQEVVQLPFSEVVTIHRHLQVGELTSHLNTAPLADLRDSSTPPPSAADDSGRSEQRFVVEVVVGRDGRSRSLACAGRDIYAFTAPIVVEGVVRLIDGRHQGAGALAPGQAFEAGDVLAALERSTDGFRLLESEPVVEPTCA